MPWTPDEEKRVRRNEEFTQANKKHLEEIQARLDRDLDGPTARVVVDARGR